MFSLSYWVYWGRVLIVEVFIYFLVNKTYFLFDLFY